MTISLQKGSSLSLQKADGSALTRVRLGLGWDEVSSGRKGFFRSLTRGGEIDLDASAILFDSAGNVVDTVYYGNLNSRDGSVRHTGDNLTGAGEGDDEQIIVDLSSVPQQVQNIVFTINSYSGQTFDQVRNVFARVVDVTAGENEVVRYNLAESANNTAVIIARLTRTSAGWQFSAIGEFTNGKTVNKVVDVAKRFI